MASPDSNDWPRPSPGQFSMAQGLADEELTIMRVRHKATGEWRTLLAIAQPHGKGAFIYGAAIMLEEAAMRTVTADYDFPPALGGRPMSLEEREAMVSQDAHGQTEALMDRIFPNRKKD